MPNIIARYDARAVATTGNVDKGVSPGIYDLRYLGIESVGITERRKSARIGIAEQTLQTWNKFEDQS
jgi:hypothetical protein